MKIFKWLKQLFCSHWSTRIEIAYSIFLDKYCLDCGKSLPLTDEEKRQQKESMGFTQSKDQSTSSTQDPSRVVPPASPTESPASQPTQTHTSQR